MKPKTKPAQPELAGNQGDESALISLLSDEKAMRYLGRSWVLRIEVLAALRTGSRSLYSLSVEYSVSRQYVSKIAKEARTIYGMTANRLTTPKR